MYCCGLWPQQLSRIALSCSQLTRAVFHILCVDIWYEGLSGFELNLIKTTSCGSIGSSVLLLVPLLGACFNYCYHYYCKWLLLIILILLLLLLTLPVLLVLLTNWICRWLSTVRVTFVRLINACPPECCLTAGLIKGWSSGLHAGLPIERFGVGHGRNLIRDLCSTCAPSQLSTDRSLSVGRSDGEG